MLKVALTGNRFSGKTKICEIFKSISVPVFDADTCINYLLCHNFEFTTKVQKNMANFFDDDYIDPKRVNTCALDKTIDVIESEIFSLYNKFCERNNHSAYVIFKSSIIFERQWDKKFDFVINIFAPVHHRIERYYEKTGIEYSEIYDLANGEILDEKKNNSSNFIIHNYDGCPDVNIAVNEVDTQIIDHYISISNPQKKIEVVNNNFIKIK